MCINLETSLLAFGIGEFSGLYLLSSSSVEKRILGIFVMFLSLIQLFEALIYYNGISASEIYSRLLLLNLGFQGFVFFTLVNNVTYITPFSLKIGTLFQLI